MRNWTLAQLLTASLGKEQNASQLLDQIMQPLRSRGSHACRRGINKRATELSSFGSVSVMLQAIMKGRTPDMIADWKAPPSAAGLFISAAALLSDTAFLVLPALFLLGQRFGGFQVVLQCRQRFLCEISERALRLRFFLIFRDVFLMVGDHRFYELIVELAAG
jgi:hypothetical protein